MNDFAPRTAVIVVAAGSGTRLAAGMPKAFVPIAGRPMLARALDGVRGMSERPFVVVVAPVTHLEDARALASAMLGTDEDARRAATVDGVAAGPQHAGPQDAGPQGAAGPQDAGPQGAAGPQDAGPQGAGLVVVAGGATRQQSVAAGLAAIPAGVETVLVHDAARALTPATLFDRIVAAVRATGHGAVPGLPVADTVKRVDAADVILETVDREQLAAVQTPQGFPRVWLDAAYGADLGDFTDDAALVAAAGHPVAVVPGDPLAFKITTPWDLQRATGLLAAPPIPRTGIGVDTHAFGGDGALWVACLEWPGERGLAGHSDGDPVAHAITDALLAAAGLGDIGGMFGTADPRFAGAHGDVFLRAAREHVEAAGFTIGNVSVQLIGNRPRFAARRAEAQAVLTGILGAPVSISATTTDGLGFTGRGEGVAAIATALVVPRR